MNLPEFPRALIHPATPAFCMAPTPDKGMGLFSTRALKMGELTLSERPLFVCTHAVNMEWPESFTHEQQIQHFLDEMEQCFKISVERMHPEIKATFLALANCYKEDGSGPLRASFVRTGCASAACAQI
ncbi:hypothetical protein B0H17DRAFT_1303996 [Mycena rosella]|uniref:Uncharacterized protein n=1 Tax=Mycena rosella TaxID=1033263 RepID=A0AAD7GG74_MYCRO|nr:hypothetical protein B0H17DRAFT_1303996 [Mycena rosella]